jgi:hypothetical protein
MSYPKWRHHPEKDSVIVHDRGEQAVLAATDQGWFDDRAFMIPDADAPEEEAPNA